MCSYSQRIQSRDFPRRDRNSIDHRQGTFGGLGNAPKLQMLATTLAEGKILMQTHKMMRSLNPLASLGTDILVTDGALY